MCTNLARLLLNCAAGKERSVDHLQLLIVTDLAHVHRVDPINSTSGRRRHLCLLLLPQVFVFCCAHADQIKAYLASSKWAKHRDMTVSTIVSTSCLSVGEALRLVDDKDVIQVSSSN